ncbi:hypothetical protein [Tardiphaga robiniae]|uniref:Uncharacterized protein n=1 Tax=Tardiphaga robiniae TaxID=943830 RepID=A0A163XP34_9BRAD|nr:hypothetical protein [Tardiphaga robiniae]KZD21165.1 hypothetical protein A4A58_15420 [Tardiphaga robiniae]
MIEPIKPGDDLFPFDIEIVNGQERVTLKKDWTDEKEIDLDIRTIDYWLQFDNEHRSAGLINMIASCSIRSRKVGTEKQKERFLEFLALREEWLRTRSTT